jgi:hypothetical protein
MTPRSIKIAVPTVTLMIAAGLAVWTANVSSAATAPQIQRVVPTVGGPTEAPPDNGVSAPTTTAATCANCGQPPVD